MIKVLFVCLGNICRSPMAEFVLKDMVQKQGIADQFYIASAATSSEEIYRGVGNPVYPPAKQELARHGISCEGKRAVQLVKSDYERYDYLIGMEDVNLRNMRRIFGEDREHKVYRLLEFTDEPGRQIADPWYSGNFELTYRQIEEGCAAFLKWLAGKEE